jgi:hypothetical protein
MKFKEGDKVVCIRKTNNWFDLDIGKTYTVKYVHYHHIEIIEVNRLWYSKKFFEKESTMRKRKLLKIKNEIQKRRHSSLYR